MTGVALILVFLAVREDLLRHRIPNTLNLAGLVLGVGLSSIAGGVSGFTHAAGGAAVGCAALILFYLRRGMGAADVKLMAAAGSFLGPSGALLAAAIALVTGAVLALAMVVRRLAQPRPRLEAAPAGEAPPVWLAAATFLTVGRERFPYAVAIGVGVLATLWLQGSLAGLLTAMGIG